MICPSKQCHKKKEYKKVVTLMWALVTYAFGQINFTCCNPFRELKPSLHPCLKYTYKKVKRVMGTFISVGHICKAVFKLRYLAQYLVKPFKDFLNIFPDYNGLKASSFLGPVHTYQNKSRFNPPI